MFEMLCTTRHSSGSYHVLPPTFNYI